MNIDFARAVIGCQEKSLRKIGKYRIVTDKYEFRLKYEGGFAAFICIDYRKIGKRNFEYFDVFGGYGCLGVHSALEKCVELIEQKVPDVKMINVVEV